MGKQSRFILISAASGFGVTVLIASYIVISGQFDSDLYTAFVFFCPPSLLCFPFSEIVKHKAGFYVIWSLIGLANSGLYAIIGAAVAGQLWKSD